MRTPDSLTALVDHGIIEQVLRPLMSGKEAQIYLVLSGGEQRVAKIYKEAQNRSFQNRADYTEGRKVRNSRDQRAMGNRSKHGKAQNEAAWKSAEVDMIYRLRDAGVRVPVPYHFIDGVLIMELVTDADGFPAPRLGDLTFEPEEATAVFNDVMGEVIRMLCAGVVHGDLSDFNVLMSADGPVVIDFPQAVDASSNANAKKLLMRDVDNLHRFHAKYVPSMPALPYAQEMWDLYQRMALTPDTRLTGKFRSNKKAVSTEAVLDLIADADHDERRRREALGLSMRGTTRDVTPRPDTRATRPQAEHDAPRPPRAERPQQTPESPRFQRPQRPDIATDNARGQRPERSANAPDNARVQRPERSGNAPDNARVQRPERAPSAPDNARFQRPERSPNAPDNARVQRPERSPNAPDNARFQRPERSPNAPDGARAQRPERPQVSDRARNERTERQPSPEQARQVRGERATPISREERPSMRWTAPGAEARTERPARREGGFRDDAPRQEAARQERAPDRWPPSQSSQGARNDGPRERSSWGARNDRQPAQRAFGNGPQAGRVREQNREQDPPRQAAREPQHDTSRNRPAPQPDGPLTSDERGFSRPRNRDS